MLEVACFNTASAVAAARAGADRIELCKDYAAGGTTPDFESLQAIHTDIEIPINVMIRPRGGGFNYSEAEFEQMKSEIELFKPYVNGFVFGILDDKDRVATRACQHLVTLASPLPCTFHRAFDQTPRLLEAAEDVILCGFQSILTSGGEQDAVTGVDKILQLQQRLKDEIVFILGGGIRATNIGALRRKGNILWYHSAAITEKGETVDEEEVQKLKAALDSNE